jgi:cobalt-zinc-cadmium efflux system membrane fusion protein
MNHPSRWLALALLALAGCAGEADPESAHADEHGHEARETEHADEAIAAIALDEVRGVRFAPVAAARREGAWFAAEAISAPGAETVLAAPVSGQIVALHATIGSAVAAGAPVVELRSAEVADLKGAWLSARARARRAASEAERERRLLEAGATSRREVEAAAAETEIAAADEQAARLALEGRGIDAERASERLFVRAPRAGVVAELDAQVGDTIEAGRRLGAVVAPGAELVRVELPLPGPESWQAGEATEVRRADGRRWSAQVEGTPPQLSPATRRLSYRLRLVGGDLPLAGTPLEARVPLAEGIVLPQVALQQVEGSWGVFVRDDELARFRPVRKGPELGSEVLVLAGVEPGEEVATEGAYLLKALWLKRTGGGEGHDH